VWIDDVQILTEEEPTNAAPVARSDDANDDEDNRRC